MLELVGKAGKGERKTVEKLMVHVTFT